MHHPGQQEQIHPPIPEHIAKKEMATAVAAATITKTEVLQTPEGPIKCITPILINEEPSDICVTKIIDAYQKEIPTIPEEAFIGTKRDPEDVPESYSEYETNKSDYLLDNVPIEPEMNLDEAEDFVDNTIVIYNVENLDASLSRIHDRFLMAAQGYEDVENLEIQEIIEDPHRSKEPSPIDDDKELEDMEEGKTAVEANKDSPTKLVKKNKKKKKEKKHCKSKTLGVKQTRHMTSTRTPTAPCREPFQY